MGTIKEVYIIYGAKFDEQFTEDYWEREFRDEMDWDDNKPKNEPFFITDGMSGDYTFFGYITLLDDGFGNDSSEIEISSHFDGGKIRNKFAELYPEVTLPELKLYYLPHYC